MRGINGPMDVITRAEFDDSMSHLPTKDDLKNGLAETRSEVVSTVKQAIKEHLGDLKVDLFAQIEEKVKRSHNLLELQAVTRSDLKDAKNEILATMRRNIGEAIEPLKADLHKMGARIDEMQDTFKSVADGHKALDETLTRLGDEMRETWKRHERILDRHDADLYKLRQSGVLQ